MNDSLLNIDVFHVIMQYATRHTVSKIMQTCHSLADIGGRYLLADAVELRTENDAMSFLCFLIESYKYGHPSRMRWVRSLVLSFGPTPPVPCRIPLVIYYILANLSLHACDFAYLRIHDTEKLLALDPGATIPDAIANLRTLRKLNLWNGGSIMLRMLCRLQACLRHAAMLAVPAAVEAATLGSAPDEQNTRQLLGGSAQYPQSLSVEGSLQLLAANSSYLALRELHIGTIDPEVVKGQFDATLFFEQQQPNNLLARPHRARTRIHKLCGPIKDLSRLELNCRADFLNAWECLAGWDDDMEEMLEVLLMDTRPVHLTLLINDAALFLIGDFYELCLLEPMQHLESFHLFMELHHYEYRQLNMAPILDAIEEGVSTITSLHAFKLTISWFPLCEFPDNRKFDDDCNDYHTMKLSWDGYEAPDSLHRFAVQDFFASWDPNTFVGSLLGASGSLKAVHVTIEGNQQYAVNVAQGSYDQFGD